MSLQSRLDSIEARVSAKTGVMGSTVIGMVHPDGHLVRALHKIGNEWIETDLEPQAYFPIKLEPLFTRPKRFIILAGGRGSGKSIGVGDKVLIDMHDNGESWLCLREFQASIKDSVHGLMKEARSRIGFDGFTVTENTIGSSGGGEARFTGIARNPGSVKSAFGLKGVWGEEAQTFSEESLKILTPTARNKPVKGLPQSMEEVEDKEVDLSKVQMIFCVNPGSSEDAFSKRFLVPFKDALDRDGIYEDDLHLIIKINWRDNPWYSLSGLEEERRWDYDNLPRALYDHIWEGEFNDSVENGLIMAEWFDACIDAHKKIKNLAPRGITKVVHDPSDKGKDPKAVIVRTGNVIMEALERDDIDVNEGCDWALDIAIQNNADQFEYDVGGMGTGLRRQVNDALAHTNIAVYQFNGANKPDFPDAVYQPAMAANVKEQKTNDQVFKNLRGQAYGSLRDRVYKTFRAIVHGEFYDPEELISFSSGMSCITKLRSELCRMPIRPNGSGLFELYTKQDMRRIFKVPSPNLGDCVMISERKHINRTNTVARMPTPSRSVSLSR